MDGIDDVDRRIITLLFEDSRRPFSDIADRVDLSAPAVSDRVDRLRERGLIRRFTLDVDRSMLREGRPVLVTLEVEPGAGERVHRALTESDPVEHAFRTVDDRVVVTATVHDGDPGDLLAAADVVEDVVSFDVRPLAAADWTPTLDSAALSPTCAECDNTVDQEGIERTVDGDRYYFCCASCETNFVERYEELREGA